MMGVADILAIWAVPVFILLIFAAGFVRKVPLFDEFTAGAADGLRSCVKVIPALVALMTAVAMLQASGALDVLTRLLQPLAERIGLPPEVVPMALMRPVSGSGSLADAGKCLSAIRTGQHGGAGGQRAAILHRNHLLHHRGLLRFGAHP